MKLLLLQVALSSHKLKLVVAKWEVNNQSEYKNTKEGWIKTAWPLNPGNWIKKKTRTQNVCVLLILFKSGVGKRINNQWHCNGGCDGPFLCVILPGLQSLVIHTLTYLGVAGTVFCIVIKVLSWLEEREIIWAGLGLPDSVGWKPWRREISIEEFCWWAPASVVLEHVLPDICPVTGDLPSRPLEPPTPVSCSESLDTHLLLVLLLCLSPDW